MAILTLYKQNLYTWIWWSIPRVMLHGKMVPCIFQEQYTLRNCDAYWESSSLNLTYTGLYKMAGREHTPALDTYLMGNTSLHNGSKNMVIDIYYGHGRSNNNTT